MAMTLLIVLMVIKTVQSSYQIKNVANGNCLSYDATSLLLKMEKCDYANGKLKWIVSDETNLDPSLCSEKQNKFCAYYVQSSNSFKLVYFDWKSQPSKNHLWTINETIDLKPHLMISTGSAGLCAEAVGDQVVVKPCKNDLSNKAQLWIK
jgi:hypothetical protein